MPSRASRAVCSAVVRLVVLAAAVALATPVGSAAQTLTLKRDLADRSAGPCSATLIGEAGLVTESDRAEAARLASSATQAAIVGDHGGARDLLLRATRLDPESGDVAYLLGRAYEELGSGASAIREYCRYLTLTPDAPDGPDVEARIATLDPDSKPALSQEAELQFRRGVAAFDLGQYATAQQAFAAVIAVEPLFGPAYFNRAVSLAASGQADASIRDLERYVELEEDPEDANQVAAAVRTLRNPPKRYSPGGAMLGSLVLPGTGQLYTGRSLAGFGFMAVAVGAVVFGELSEKVQIECRVPPTAGVCQPSNIVSETREKPFRAAAYGTAAAVALYAAIDAYRGAGRRNASAGAGLTVALGSDRSPSFVVPQIGLNRRGQVTLRLLRLSF